MKAIRFGIVASLLAATLTFAPTALAGVTTTRSFPVDRVTCGMLNRAVGVVAPDTSCVAQVALHPFADVGAVSATGCSGYWETFNLYSAGDLFVVMTDHVNVGLCFNGSTVWRNWGADCYFSGSPLLYGATDWCGVYNSGGSFAEPGDNFSITAYPTPWWHRYGYFRYRVNAYGQVTAIWGYCCS